jgi:TRAP-type C4-dicarboxylate transport system permease small subunit
MAALLLRITRWLDRLEKMITAVTAVIIGLLSLLVGWQVIARYVFSSGQFWVEEFTLAAMMWAALLGAAACIWTDSHVRLNILLDHLPAGFRLFVRALTDGLLLWFAFVLIKEGLLLVERTMGGRMSALPVPIGVTYIVLPAAAVLMVAFASIRAVQRILDHFDQRKESG